MRSFILFSILFTISFLASVDEILANETSTNESLRVNPKCENSNFYCRLRSIARLTLKVHLENHISCSKNNSKYHQSYNLGAYYCKKTVVDRDELIKESHDCNCAQIYKQVTGQTPPGVQLTQDCLSQLEKVGYDKNRYPHYWCGTNGSVYRI